MRKFLLLLHEKVDLHLAVIADGYPPLVPYRVLTRPTRDHEIDPGERFRRRIAQGAGCSQGEETLFCLFDGGKSQMALILPWHELILLNTVLPSVNIHLNLAIHS